MNEKIEPGVIMNALAHTYISFGADIGQEPLHLTNYVDADGEKHPHISEMPYGNNKLSYVEGRAGKKPPICIFHIFA